MKLTRLIIIVAVACGATEPEAATPRAPDASHEGMIHIPAGSFTMGSDDGLPNEGPPRGADVAAFFIDEREVSVDAYAECVRARACDAPATGRAFCNFEQLRTRRDHPMNCVTWKQASAYCTWRGKRLPTEQEWEYAARGTDGRKFPWGVSPPTSSVCFRRHSEGTCPIASTPADKSAFGVLDMGGNVSEWTSSEYREDYRKGELEPPHVVRGGSWYVDNETHMRASVRDGVGGADPSSSVGIRCARTDSY